MLWNGNSLASSTEHVLRLRCHSRKKNMKFLKIKRLLPQQKTITTKNKHTHTENILNIFNILNKAEKNVQKSVHLPLTLYFTSVSIFIFFVHSLLKTKVISQKQIYTSYSYGEWDDSFLSMDAHRSLYSHQTLILHNIYSL